MKDDLVWHRIDCLVLDFDGVFTDNRVYVSESGEEMVACNRGDGLGIGMMKRFFDAKKKSLEILILSKERNSVVQRRAMKLGIVCKNGVDDKAGYLKEMFRKREIVDGQRFRGVIYLGNDLNDLGAMSLCEFPVCPADAHARVKASSRLVLDTAGGAGCIRELIEVVLGFEDMNQNELESLL